MALWRSPSHTSRDSSCLRTNHLRELPRATHPAHEKDEADELEHGGCDDDRGEARLLPGAQDTDATVHRQHRREQLVQRAVVEGEFVAVARLEVAVGGEARPPLPRETQPTLSPPPG